MANIKKYLNKLYNEIILIKNTDIFKISLVIISFFLPILVERFHYSYEKFSLDRYICITLVLLFLSLHLILNVKKLWDFIYKYRYIISLLLFIFLVSSKYHGSSITIYNNLIEPSEVVEYGNNIIGQNRGIRADEWSVTTLHNLSQTTPINDLSKINKTMMGGEGNAITFYPKMPTKTLSVILAPKMIGFIFLPRDYAFSFYWFFDYFALFLISFEFFMILTKKNKLFSLVGAIMVTFAPATQWWEATSILTPGMLAMILFNKFLNSKDIKIKVLLSILIGYVGSIYIMSMYPAWMIPYGYFFLGIVIWLMIIKRGKYTYKDILLLVLIASLTISVLIIPTFIESKEIYTKITSTLYPGARFSTGGDGFKLLFNYVISIFLPFITIGNASEASQFISFYPIPFILGCLIIYKNFKNKEKDSLIIILTLLIFLLSIWNYIKIPDFVARITFLYMSTPYRCQVVVGFITLVLLIVYLSNYENLFKINKKNIILYIIISLLITLLIVFINNNYYNFMDKKIFIFSVILFTIIISLILLNKYKKVVSVLLIILSLITGLTVHPINKTLNVIYQKPFSKEVRKIVDEDPSGLWATVSTTYYVQNYVLANGAKVLNSTNYYPNYSLWNLIDKDKKYENIWNRYSHMTINLKKEKTSLELLYEDHIILNLNVNDICVVGIDYLVSNDDSLSNYSNDLVDITNIYSNDNMYIYDINC